MYVRGVFVATKPSLIAAAMSLGKLLGGVSLASPAVAVKLAGKTGTIEKLVEEAGKN
jgi:hypothetical protein